MFTKGQKIVITYQVKPGEYELRKGLVDHYRAAGKSSRTGNVRVKTPGGFIYRFRECDITKDTPGGRKIANRIMDAHHGQQRNAA